MFIAYRSAKYARELGRFSRKEKSGCSAFAALRCVFGRCFRLLVWIKYIAPVLFDSSDNHKAARPFAGDTEQHFFVTLHFLAEFNGLL